MALLSNVFFFFNDTATTEIYTLSLHDALPISSVLWALDPRHGVEFLFAGGATGKQELDAVPGIQRHLDRKSTRLNSSHGYISYAVFCLKKKNYPSSSHSSRQRSAA